MNTQLTPFSKFLITVGIVAGIFFGGKYIAENTLWGQKLMASRTESTTHSSSSKENKDESLSASSFGYVPAEPVNGVLKGVVELGASGFNSFIVRIDKNKNWKLEKSEFGNSLVTENMATDDDIRIGLKKYIGKMLDYGVSGRAIHFVVSSGALKAENTEKIIKVLKSMSYFVNKVTPEQEGSLALKCVLPKDFEEEGFVVDIGSGNTKISWVKSGSVSALESYGAKYFQKETDDGKVFNEVKQVSSQVPTNHRKVCFIIGGVPFQMAKQIRKGKERYTVLEKPTFYTFDDAKAKAGINIYKAIQEATQTESFVFDWDANFTIGFLLGLN